MANIAVRQPTLVRQAGNLNIQKPPVTDGSNTFLAGSFVQISSGSLQAVPTTSATASTKLVYGWAPSASKASTDIPPATLYGQMHYPFDPAGAEFEINATNAEGDIGETTGDTTASITGLSLAVGSSYGIITDGDGIQMLAGENTTNTLVTIVSLGDNAVGDINPRVRVKLVSSANIQA